VLARLRERHIGCKRDGDRVLRPWRAGTLTYVLHTHGRYNAVCRTLPAVECVARRTVRARNGHGVERHWVVLRKPQRRLIVVPVPWLPGIGLRENPPCVLADTRGNRILETRGPGIRPNGKRHAAALDASMHLSGIDNHQSVVDMLLASRRCGQGG